MRLVLPHPLGMIHSEPVYTLTHRNRRKDQSSEDGAQVRSGMCYRKMLYDYTETSITTTVFDKLRVYWL